MIDSLSNRTKVNKTIKIVLNANISKTAVIKGTRNLTRKWEIGIHYKYFNCRQFMAGISNVIIEELIEEEDVDFYTNFVGAFLFDRPTSVLNFLKIFWIQIAATYQVLIGGA